MVEKSLSARTWGYSDNNNYIDNSWSINTLQKAFELLTKVQQN